VNRNLPAVWGVVLGLVLGAASHAAPPAVAQTEINYLLGYIECSGCEFYHNGIWYDSKTAQAHIRSKYEFLAGRGEIDTAEDFIEIAATQSSLSGQPYKVRCHDGVVVTTNLWLHVALTGYRRQNEIGAPRITHGAPRIVPLDSQQNVSRPSGF
jgi:Family of unknown function (DUF5329)